MAAGSLALVQVMCMRGNASTEPTSLKLLANSRHTLEISDPGKVLYACTYASK